jgi:hypothetical protein
VADPILVNATRVVAIAAPHFVTITSSEIVPVAGSDIVAIGVPRAVAVTTPEIVPVAGSDFIAIETTHSVTVTSSEIVSIGAPHSVSIAGAEIFPIKTTRGVLVVPKVADHAAKVLCVRIAIRAHRADDLAEALSRLLVHSDLIEAHRPPAIHRDF